ncbi:hypothetical protein CC1G_13947 [Coprinopsis cinerea okayama7|uniref:Uncharacterized protein n=1 Tax=Coprinopsis cinerea (strain Okayama-7 / 130 / ATCC MYA-4618 / FGSC 9003) TaxID=240176 RepID=D6RKQ5_COPC7|nr:hypothetical protein CC1G_13947 [Coprinopsis cinerea okayama7\|eukprot:XP_002911907.1 hypothetical protein CC1G_13947 [Coprinopsis cinerea okayama7\
MYIALPVQGLDELERYGIGIVELDCDQNLLREELMASVGHPTQVQHQSRQGLYKPLCHRCPVRSFFASLVANVPINPLAVGELYRVTSVEAPTKNIERNPPVQDNNDSDDENGDERDIQVHGY